MGTAPADRGGSLDDLPPEPAGDRWARGAIRVRADRDLRPAAGGRDPARAGDGERSAASPALAAVPARNRQLRAAGARTDSDGLADLADGRAHGDLRSDRDRCVR